MNVADIFLQRFNIASEFTASADICLINGDTLDTLKKLPDGTAKLIITSPPYNIGKEYETQTALHEYLDWLKPIIIELMRVLDEKGSVCWQVG